MPDIGSTFRVDAPLLGDLMGDIAKATLQLPDFQRGWVWDDDHIKALIASVTMSYPIGAVMLLDCADDGIKFAPRLVEGVEPVDKKPDSLILDGQQRLTSLFLAMKSGKSVPTKTEKGQKIERVYYLDMAKCLDPECDRVDAVLSIPATKQVTSDFGRQVDLDLTTRELELEQSLIPLTAVFEATEFLQWMADYQEHHRYDPARGAFGNAFQRQVWLALQQYRVPVIVLLASTPKEAVCQVFENVNTGGVTLSVFELVTATFAADDFRLRPDWEARKERMSRHPVLRDFDSTAFLTSITLLSSFQRSEQENTAVACKRKDVLKLDLEDYKRLATLLMPLPDDFDPKPEQDRLPEGALDKVARFLTREKVFDAWSLPYSTQLIPLAAICAYLGTDFENDEVRRKLARWYWCGVFGELYGGANESRYANDLPDVIRWTRGGEEPRTVRDSSFSPTRLLSLQTRQSAAYKGLMAQLMLNGSDDFLSGDPIEVTTYFDLAVDIHHIFPRHYCEAHQFDRFLWNSSVNKAPLTGRTNRRIGGEAPSKYLVHLQATDGVTPERLDSSLRSHLIDPELLRADSFDEFIRDRAARLLSLIERATGRTVSGRDSEEVVNAFGGSLYGSSATVAGAPGTASPGEG